jgi:hypothetical protein
MRTILRSEFAPNARQKFTLSGGQFIPHMPPPQLPLPHTGASQGDSFAPVLTKPADISFSTAKSKQRTDELTVPVQ